MVKKTQSIDGKNSNFLAFLHPDWFLPSIHIYINIYTNIYKEKMCLFSYLPMMYLWLFCICLLNKHFTSYCGILNNVYCWQIAVSYIVYTVYTLVRDSVLFTIHSVQCAVFYILHKVYSAQCTMIFVLCTMHIDISQSSYTVYGIQCPMYFTQCKKYRVQCAVPLYLIHSTQSAVSYVLYAQSNLEKTNSMNSTALNFLKDFPPNLSNFPLNLDLYTCK